MKHLVFVYGTLKKGCRNDHYLIDAKFITKTRTAESHFNMVEMGSYDVPDNTYPATTKDGQASVRGELYEVDDTILEGLDELEELGVRFERIQIPLSCDKSTWIYLHIHSSEAQTEPRQVNYDANTNELFWTES